MRIEALSIHNFRGIRHFEISGLANEPLVTVSGRNGSGKSLIFEAIGVLWWADRLARTGQPLVSRFLIGSWGDDLSIELVIRLTQEECRTLELGVPELPPLEDPAPSEFIARLHGNRDSGFALEANHWVERLRNFPFSQHHTFGQIDHLPADRSMPRGEQAQVNPTLLSEAQRDQLRTQIVGSYAQQRQVVGISGVAPLLATADYLDLLAEREGQPTSGDFDAITDPFYSATGKRILRPSTDPTNPYGAGIRVETPSATNHPLDQLSSGEQEGLSLSFFVRRLRANGGVLLIDEPELHLHPALQRSLFSQLEEVAERAQVWIVTHSPRLVTAASLEAILHMRAPSADDENQVQRASDEEDRVELLDDLGVHPLEVLQNQFLVFVEGPTDEQRLSALLPLDLAPAVVKTAGGGPAVERASQSLGSTETLHFLGIRDRDLLSDNEVEKRIAQCPGLFVWPLRMLENELLEPRLLSRTLARAGVRKSEDEVAEELRQIADSHRPEILADLVEAELHARHELKPTGESRIERLQSYLQEMERVGAAKLHEFEAVTKAVQANLDAGWEADHLKLMDGKRALGQYVSHTPYESVPALVNAISATLRDEPELLPAGLVALRERLQHIALATRRD